MISVDFPTYTHTFIYKMKPVDRQINKFNMEKANAPKYYNPIIKCQLLTKLLFISDIHN